mmetsp:Transcript_11901/g.47815  ORF Transcript_11901/g.47815 Transcript_11901/m.47815 type:complete len:244 (+) Transcript_11901:528-1259(+)
MRRVVRPGPAAVIRRLTAPPQEAEKRVLGHEPPRLNLSVVRRNLGLRQRGGVRVPRAQRRFDPVEVLRVRRQELIRDEERHAERLRVVGANLLQHRGARVARQSPRLDRHRGRHDVLRADDDLRGLDRRGLKILEAGAKAADHAADGRERAANLFLGIFAGNVPLAAVAVPFAADQRVEQRSRRRAKELSIHLCRHPDLLGRRAPPVEPTRDEVVALALPHLGSDPARGHHGRVIRHRVIRRE